ncbi:MAG: DNA repair ATPase [Deltaproteobacteria bacterium]|nr:DNA repair ATPase [Deltaproteobacteria bacterium]
MSEAQAVDAAVTGGGNYEVIRARLIKAGDELARRAEALNAERKSRFGGTELSIIANTRVRTEAACLPRAVLQVEGRLVFGFNVTTFRKKIELADLFSVHKLIQAQDGLEFEPVSFDETPWLKDANFVRELDQLFEFYRDTRLLQLRQTERAKLLAIFQVGQTHKDIKVFRWSVDSTGAPTYIDDRGERDNTAPEQTPFDWKTPGREEYVSGQSPHISILGKCFVETIGGDLTVKIEDNTESGQGIYSEPVDDPKQSLDDGQFQYCAVGPLILLKVLPYREKVWRHLIFNTITRSVVRIDAIGQSAVPLDEGHGLVFPKGYYLRTGEHKLFDFDTEGLELKRVMRSPNGEDVLYIFRRPTDGHIVLFPYNKIRQEVQTPIQAHGTTVFEDGKLVVFRMVSEEPTKVHPVQIWQTPFCSDVYYAALPTDGSLYAKIGNAELVRGISDALALQRLIKNTEPTRQVFEDLTRACTRAIDTYHWLTNAELGDLASVITDIRRTGELIIDEFEKVQTLRREATLALGEAEKTQGRLLIDTKVGDWREVEQYLVAMTSLRRQRGHLISLKEVKFIDLARVDVLEKQVIEAFDAVSRSCVTFLLGGTAFKPMLQRIEALPPRGEAIQKAHEIKPLLDELEVVSEGLNLLAEVVGGLNVDDPTSRTTILEGVSEVFSQLNRARASLSGRQKQLAVLEGKAEFGAQFKLLSQSVSNAITLADTPERCDEQLSKLMLQVEELEGRFGELEEFLPELASKREEIYEALSGRKQTLLDARQRRVEAILNAAGRILEGIGRRARTFKAEDELNTYFASDAMVLKLRQSADQLRDLGDTVKAEELEGRLKSARQDAVRTLRDATELFEGGGDLIRFGRHQFTVNTQPLELTLVPKGDGMALHLTGTDFHEPVDDAEFEATRPFWTQTMVSETESVYRGEYLAVSMLFAAEAGRANLSVSGLQSAALGEGGLLGLVRAYAADRYDEGYERGVHDHDAALILDKLLAARSTAGTLRFPSPLRAAAAMAWSLLADKERRERFARRARSLRRLRDAFGSHPAWDQLADELGELTGATVAALRLRETALDATSARLAGASLAEELSADRPRFSLSAPAAQLIEQLQRRLDDAGVRSGFDDDLRALEKDPRERFGLARAWLDACLSLETDADRRAQLAQCVDEAAARLCTERLIDWQVSNALTTVDIPGMLGQHPRIKDRAIRLQLDELLGRLTVFIEERVPAYLNYRALRHALVERHRKRLRLDEFTPRVMSSFVRNKLINDVYLPVVGDNLAKQMGAAGAGKRTDLMGLLLLVSPPGYGKTTLMEYVASRLGLVFMKVNGPSLGHSVHSFDPVEAPNATARQEVEKINLAFEMGNNVMLYLDDIQHTHPELLQKFISLCDGTRRVEGVWNGRTRTYDLRGKKFCVVMAGNPYTETGEKFRIPDMLANRADTYNLGDILEGREEVFGMSYVENALTSNAALAPLSSRSQDDVYKLIRIAKGEEINPAELSHNYSAVEIGEITAVLKRLFTIQSVVLKVNQQYVLSAAQEDSYRQEPPFKLQGSYRNMNKMAEKVVSAMNEAELERLIDDHYAGESQTLTTGAEQNMLKLAELRGRITDEQRERWLLILKEFRRLKSMGGKDDDPVHRLTGSLGALGERLENIQETLADGKATQTRLDNLHGALGEIHAALRDTSATNATQSRLDGLREALQGIHLAVKDHSSTEAQLGGLSRALGGIQAALVDPSASQATVTRLDTLNKTLLSVSEALRASEGTTSRLDALNETLNTNLQAVQAALTAGTPKELDARLGALNETLTGVVAALNTPALDPTRKVLIALTKEIITIRKLYEAPKTDAGAALRMDQLVQQLSGLREAVIKAPEAIADAMPAPMPMARGVGQGAPLGTAHGVAPTMDPLAAIMAAGPVGTASERSKARGELYSEAQRSLRGEPRPIDPARAATLSAALNVVQDLVLRTTEVAAQYLSENERRAFTDELRRQVALALAELREV